MIAYPFSGITRSDVTYITDSDYIEVKQLIEKYCDIYKIDPIQLINVPYGGFKKVTQSGVNTATMRMALAYFIRERFKIPYTVIGVLVGYTNHTTPITNKKKITNYIKHKDRLFYPYWQSLLKIA